MYGMEPLVTITLKEYEDLNSCKEKIKKMPLETELYYERWKESMKMLEEMNEEISLLKATIAHLEENTYQVIK